MSGSYDDRQAKIDALFQSAQFDQIPVQKKLLELARKGSDHPADLTDQEIQTLCYALIVHYHQMGIE